MKYINIISTTDPINGFNITSLKDRPHVVEGDDMNNLTIYFENRASRQTYLDMIVEQPERHMASTLSNSTADYSH
ncbi:MAG: hypothetical protein OEN49_03565 [Gammaproteobacteria bacterium]|nr:hypothetical protein [Gammaproteobacteria bacterium]MDH3562463.1 hypothetical protein [Gammaproteobacteria bacterium]